MLQPNRKEYDWTAALLLACTGLASAFAAMCISYPFGHYAVMKGRLVDFSQFFIPGVLFGAAISGFLAFRGYLRSPWKVIAVCFECAVAYLLAVWTAFGVELFSRFIDYDARRGVVSGQSLVIGGFVGGLCILYSIEFLLNSESTRKRRISRALYWGAAGGILGIAGWSLGPIVGMAFWQIVSSMNLTAPTETYQNALGETSHMYSLLAVWQAGMGAVIGLTVSTRKPQEAQTWRTLT